MCCVTFSTIYTQLAHCSCVNNVHVSGPILNILMMTSVYCCMARCSNSSFVAPILCNNVSEVVKKAKDNFGGNHTVEFKAHNRNG